MINGRLRVFMLEEALHQLFHASLMLLPSQRCEMFSEESACTQIWREVVRVKNKCSFDSSSCWQMTHQEGPKKDLFIRLVHVGVLFMMMFHMKSHVRGGALSFQIAHHQLSSTVGLWVVWIMGYPSFGEYAPCAVGAQIRSSSSSLYSNMRFK